MRANNARSKITIGLKRFVGCEWYRVPRAGPPESRVTPLMD
jgi:hypothetical protein